MEINISEENKKRMETLARQLGIESVESFAEKIINDFCNKTKGCSYYLDHLGYCSRSFFDQSYCLGKCVLCDFTIDDYKEHEETYPHLFNEEKTKGENKFG